MSESFKIDAERQYRRVYQGTKYTVTWTDAEGEHKATSRSFNKLMRFINNGYKLDTRLTYRTYGVKVTQ